MPAVPSPLTIETGVSDTTKLNLFRYVDNFFLNKPAFAVYSAANQSVPNATLTALTFDTEYLDDDPAGGAGHSTSVDTSRYTAQYAGWYRVSGLSGWAAN